MSRFNQSTYKSNKDTYRIIDLNEVYSISDESYAVDPGVVCSTGDISFPHRRDFYVYPTKESCLAVIRS